MSGSLVLFIIVLITLAAVFRADFVMILLYLLAGVFVGSHWWGRGVMKKISIRRNFSERAFLGEKVPVHIEAHNSGSLPLVWGYIRETLPLDLAPEGTSQEVITIGARKNVKFDYTLDCLKRGYYSIGPLYLFSGDLLGLMKQQTRQFPEDHLTVFPKIIPLARVGLPTQSRLGTFRFHQPLSEDPSRVRGKRDYLTGDSLRKVDWKASAATRKLQVKLYEPSITMETMIFLNLNREEFEIKDLHRASELGIVVAASLASWIIQARQAVGLATNGIDSLTGEDSPLSIPSRSGQGHLMHILEILARVQIESTYPLVNLIQREVVHLSWGSTMILITNTAGDDLFKALFRARQRGIGSVLVLCGYVEHLIAIQRWAAFFNFPFYHFMTERDLDVWRD